MKICNRVFLLSQRMRAFTCLDACWVDLQCKCNGGSKKIAARNSAFSQRIDPEERKILYQKRRYVLLRISSMAFNSAQ